jgi:ribonucleoside-diphosphate reductase alpha chain
MSTSIIDYIFRELAITYLGRSDLAHVNPEDLRADAQHDPEDDPDFDEEEVVAERTVDARAALAAPLSHPRSSHLKPGAPAKPGSEATPQPAPRPGNGNGNGGNGNGKTNGNGNGNGGATATRGTTTPAAGTQADKIRIARQMGYEGDPCPNCQALKLVRSGACMRCDNCGATSGCG